MVQSLQLQSQQSRGGFSSLCPLERHSADCFFFSSVSNDYNLHSKINIVYVKYRLFFPQLLILGLYDLWGNTVTSLKCELVLQTQ